jgi:hypothetical protein
VGPHWTIERKYDAEHFRVSRLFHYTHTWRNVTEIAFIHEMIQFQFGQNRERTPLWFSFAFDDAFADKFAKHARELTTSFKMEMTRFVPGERFFAEKLERLHLERWHVELG